ncbi:HAUS augmin-like complex subunit 5 isoform X2 [Microcaecilia unicolor]|uniref:HAUS augmin-like complex subunit 5 isoform X2 n=1 Tax=Microcaecilia unicolor TaxID=1415580 RepID=A0A6P7YU66_9AMPH|nr:HAUS augmin-like complex subunit 5 isoform X2 [Microcaecilia unicolor]
MERKNLTQELKKWAMEEMGLPAHKIPSETVLRKLCVGQSADIWKYVIRHVHSLRNVKKIEGNLLWYQHLQQSEVKQSESELQQARRKQLVKEISALKLEVPQLIQQIKMAEREVIANETLVEASFERIQDARRRTLLLKAYSAKKEQEREKLHESNSRLSHRVDQLQEMSRKANEEVLLGAQAPDPNLSVSSFCILEPEVLRDVKEACQMRFQFLKSLHDDSVAGNLHSVSEELRRTSHQQWLSVVENILSAHAPNHILAALEHLARQNTSELQKLTSSMDIDHDIQALKFRFESSHLEDVSETRSALPSVHCLIQEGWSACEKLWVQQVPLQVQVTDLSARLASMVQEKHQLLSDGSARSLLAREAFDLELRVVMLKAHRDALLQECHALEDEACAKKQELQTLQQKHQRIADFQQFVERKQEQIQILIKGNSCLKSQLLKSQREVQQFVQRRLLTPEQDVETEVQQLRGGVQRELKQFSRIFLPCLLHRVINGTQRVPAHELSIHHLDNMLPWDSLVFAGVCQSLKFPLYKAPEKILIHAAELKKVRMHLHGQISYKTTALNKLQMKKKQSQAPDVQTLIKMVRDHDVDQVALLVPKIQHLIQQCVQSINKTKDIQQAVTDWWDQPGQFALSWETRHGLSLCQWLERWTLALRTLQQQQHSSWAS